jgi:hypothetical protein
MMQLAVPKQNGHQECVVQLDTKAHERRGSRFLQLSRLLAARPGMSRYVGAHRLSSLMHSRKNLQGHNLEVVGSNPTPATNLEIPLVRHAAAYCLIRLCLLGEPKPGRHQAVKAGAAKRGRDSASLYGLRLVRFTAVSSKRTCRRTSGRGQATTDLIRSHRTRASGAMRRDRRSSG